MRYSSFSFKYSYFWILYIHVYIYIYIYIYICISRRGNFIKYKRFERNIKKSRYFHSQHNFRNTFHFVAFEHQNSIRFVRYATNRFLKFLIEFPLLKPNAAQFLSGVAKQPSYRNTRNLGTQREPQNLSLFLPHRE